MGGFVTALSLTTMINHDVVLIKTTPEFIRVGWRDACVSFLRRQESSLPPYGSRGEKKGGWNKLFFASFAPLRENGIPTTPITPCCRDVRWQTPSSARNRHTGACNGG